MDDLDDELAADVYDYIAIDDMTTWWRGNHMAADVADADIIIFRKMTLAHSIC
jgi:septum formation inhibitor-activating ATPase MinD